jgi:mercuric ion transport protein
MVVQDENAGRLAAGSGHNAAKTAFAAAGLVAAFGVASCCALPIALSLLGIGAASLAGIGTLAAPYQPALLYAAVISLGAAGVIMWRQRRTRVCHPGAACAHSRLDLASKVAVLAALGLLPLTFWIEPPI